MVGAGAGAWDAKVSGEGAFAAGCDATEVAAVDDLASDRAVDEVVDRFLS